MRSDRISIAGLMLAVFVFGLGLAAMLRPSEIASKAAFTAACAALIVSILGVIHATGPRRVGWSGYLVASGDYLAVSLGPWLCNLYGPHLLTSSINDLAYERLRSTPSQDGAMIWVSNQHGSFSGKFRPDPSFAGEGFLIRDDLGGQGHYPAADLRPFAPEVMQRLGHSLFSMPIGLMGAYIALHMARRERSAGRDRPDDWS